MTDSSRRQLIDDIRTAISEQTDETDILRTAAELIDGFSEDYAWTGFYLMRDGALHVGPYIGPKTPHTRIELDRGICGAAASRKQSIIVDDVRSDSRFLACSLSTRSEIVVPLLDGEMCLGEIDIDSDKPCCFSDDDRKMLEAVAAVIVERLKTAR